MTSKIKTLTLGLVVAAAALALTPSATAQGFLGFSFEKHKRGKHIGFSIGIPLGRNEAPVVHRHGSCCKTFIPGHYETRIERVWVPRMSRRIRAASRYRPHRMDRRRHGARHMRGRRGYWRNVRREVWIEGRFVINCGH